MAWDSERHDNQFCTWQVHVALLVLKIGRTPKQTLLVSGRVLMKEAKIRKGMGATPWQAIKTNIAPCDLRLHKYEHEFQICTPLTWFTWKSAPASLEISFGNHHFDIPFVQLWGWKNLFRCKAVKKIRVSQKYCKLTKTKVLKTFLKRPACVFFLGKRWSWEKYSQLCALKCEPAKSIN